RSRQEQRESESKHFLILEAPLPGREQIPLGVALVDSLTQPALHLRDHGVKELLLRAEVVDERVRAHAKRRSKRTERGLREPVFRQVVDHPAQQIITAGQWLTPASRHP